ncbi:MAG: hypothetical protein WCJ61_02510, partial [Paludibacter sp.]
MKKFLFNISTLIISMYLLSCSQTPEIDDSMLDAGMISYNIPDSLQKHLVSAYITHPTLIQQNTPIIIAAHGYTATTFEWDELRTEANLKGTFYVSQVLLGGHGSSYDAFKKATWEDWEQSINEEYRKLDSLVYKKIYLAGSSTVAPLIINMVKTGLEMQDYILNNN